MSRAPFLRLLLVLEAVVSALCLSCAADGKAAVLWTDKPEFALYAEYFNTAQEKYKVAVRYFDSPADKLAEAGEHPDIVAGSLLKSASTRVFFKPLDRYFGRNSIVKEAFYPRLLATGNISGRQYLLPVSFNAPAIIFSRGKAGLLANPFTTNLDELKTLGREYNRQTGGVFSRMGFSPAWNDSFLFMTANLFNASFREDAPLAWDSPALERAMSYVNDWTREINGGVQAEEDFTFKYFYDPPAKLVLSGRILFTSINSDVLFTLAQEQRSSLDFRWIAEQNTIPLTEDAVYLGMAKKSKSPRAAAAFLRWFFQTGTQREILEMSRNNRVSETIFGISGGFSSLRPVTEQIFPRFYPDLLGHMPPEDFLSPANILPRGWNQIKERAIFPYLRDRVRQSARDSVYPLERRIADLIRQNN